MQLVEKSVEEGANMDSYVYILCDICNSVVLKFRKGFHGTYDKDVNAHIKCGRCKAAASVIL